MRPAAAVIAVSLIAALVLAERTHAAFPGQNGQIYYETFIGDPNNPFGWFANITAINSDGSGNRYLTNDGDSNNPSASPDGQRVAYDREGRSGRVHIWTMRIDGSDKRRVTRGRVRDFSPSWAPDGRQLVFQRGRKEAPGGGGGIPVGDNYDLWRVNADGSGLRRLTEDASNHVPAWSPNGQWIVWARDRPGFSAAAPIRDVWRMRPDGSASTEIVQDAIFPDVSPDGSSLLSTSHAQTDSSRIYRANFPSGQQHRPLASLAAGGGLADGWGVWSPDGQHVAFARVTPTRNVLWTANVDGSDSRPIADPGNRVEIRNLSWQPFLPSTPAPPRADNLAPGLHALRFHPRRGVRWIQFQDARLTLAIHRRQGGGRGWRRVSRRRFAQAQGVNSRALRRIVARKRLRNGKRLRPGSYRARLVARNAAGKRSKPVTRKIHVGRR